MPISPRKHSKSYDGQNKEESKLQFTCYVLYTFAVTTEKKKTVNKAKIPDVYSEQTESSSDNDSEFSDTSSKGIEEEVSWSPYRTKKIPNKSICS